METVWYAEKVWFEICLLVVIGLFTGEVAIVEDLLIEPGIVIALNCVREVMFEDFLAFEEIAY